MSQTTIERLRDYLAQLPPQSQALLMRRFERAVERGEEVAIANLVLEQLRKIVRGAEEEDEAPARTDDPARLLFRPLEPFLAEGSFPVRPGQIHRASLLPVWQWLARDGVPEQRANSRRNWPGRAATARRPSSVQPAASSACRSGGDRQDRHACARRRQAAGAGPRRPPDVVDDLLSIGWVLRAREALGRWVAGFPGPCGRLAIPRSPR
jgi:hypothetical protein